MIGDFVGVILQLLGQVADFVSDLIGRCKACVDVLEGGENLLLLRGNTLRVAMSDQLHGENSKLKKIFFVNQ